MQEKEKNFIDDYRPSKEELQNLLQQLTSIENNSQLNRNEQDLLEFLKKQINLLIKNSYKESEVPENREPHFPTYNLKNVLENNTGKFLFIDLKTGGNCCQVEGILCNVYTDFIVLINGKMVYSIKINKITSIKHKVNNYFDGVQQQVEYHNQFSLGEIDETVEEEDRNSGISRKEYKLDNNKIKIRKRQKNYTKSEEKEGEAI